MLTSNQLSFKICLKVHILLVACVTGFSGHLTNIWYPLGNINLLLGTILWYPVPSLAWTSEPVTYIQPCVPYRHTHTPVNTRTAWMVFSGSRTMHQSWWHVLHLCVEMIWRSGVTASCYGEHDTLPLSEESKILLLPQRFISGGKHQLILAVLQCNGLGSIRGSLYWGKGKRDCTNWVTQLKSTYSCMNL